MKISIMFSVMNTSMDVEVESDWIVDKVKEKMQDIVQCPPFEQVMFFKGEELNNGRTLGYYGIVDGSSVDLLVVNICRGPMYVKSWNGIITTVWAYETPFQIKSKLHREESIPCNKQVLLFNGQELEDDIALKEKDIPSGATLYMEKTEDVTMRGPTERTKVVLILDTNKGEVANYAEYEATSGTNHGAMLEPVALHQHKFTTELEAPKDDLAAAECKKEKKSEAKWLSILLCDEQRESLHKKWSWEDEKTKWLDRLTQGALQFFHYGFESCQKQAEEQGFVGQLDKDAALQDAPKLWSLF